ncbi:MAG: hypothetical protein EBE86_017860 [Hormoscilla sp. GUM202]|nr:hypothetical protein [Hormoscilla sp. GUM202]
MMHLNYIVKNVAGWVAETLMGRGLPRFYSKPEYAVSDARQLTLFDPKLCFLSISFSLLLTAMHQMYRLGFVGQPNLRSDRFFRQKNDRLGDERLLPEALGDRY